MKTLILLLACGLVVSACGSGTDADVGDCHHDHRSRRDNDHQRD